MRKLKVSLRAAQAHQKTRFFTTDVKPWEAIPSIRRGAAESHEITPEDVQRMLKFKQVPPIKSDQKANEESSVATLTDDSSSASLKQ
jgi:hypothetical protein